MSHAQTHHTQQCIKCENTFPTTHFRYRGTRAQALAKGLSGKRLPWIESKLCRQCRPPRKPIRELTRAELANRYAAGDISQLAYDNELKRRKLEETKRKSEYMKMHHAMRKHLSLKPADIKLFLLEQHIKKEQANQLKQAQRDAKHSAKLSTPPRKRGRPPKQLIPTTPLTGQKSVRGETT